jgi:hypothetical protein
MDLNYKLTSGDDKLRLELVEKGEGNFYPSEFINALVDVMGYHDAVFYLMNHLFSLAQAKPSLIEGFNPAQFALDIKEVYDRHFPRGESPPEGIDGWGYIDEEEFEIFILRTSGEPGDDILVGGNPAKATLAWDAYRNPGKYGAVISSPSKWKDYDGRFCQIHLVRIPSNRFS